MTPFELDLLKTFWPWLWSGGLFLGGLYVRTVSRQVYCQIADLSSKLDRFGTDLKTAEQEISETREETRHRLDVLIGKTDTRVSRIEAVCETQHGIMYNRRSTDQRAVNWAQESDVVGSSVKR